jgi:hypothetical protein
LEVLDWSPSNKMFLDDALEILRSAGMIPNSFRIDDSNRPLNAYPQAVSFATVK